MLFTLVVFVPLLLLILLLLFCFARVHLFRLYEGIRCETEREGTKAIKIFCTSQSSPFLNKCNMLKLKTKKQKLISHTRPKTENIIVISFHKLMIPFQNNLGSSSLRSLAISFAVRPCKLNEHVGCGSFILLVRLLLLFLSFVLVCYA